MVRQRAHEGMLRHSNHEIEVQPESGLAESKVENKMLHGNQVRRSIFNTCLLVLVWSEGMF